MTTVRRAVREAIRPPAEWALPTRMSPPLWVAFAGYFAALIIGTLLASLSGDPTGDPPAVLQLLAQLGFWSGLVGTALVASRQWGSGNLRADLRLGGSASVLVIGALLGVLTQLLVLPALYWVIQLFTGPLDVGAAADELLHGGGAVRFVIVVAGAVLVAPVVEEVFFRGVLLTAIGCRAAPWVAIVGSSALFAASHLQGVQFPGLFVGGVVFALLACSGARLGPAISAHMAFNATAVLAHLAFQP